MSLAERIKAAEAELVQLKDNLVNVTKSLEETPDDDSLLAQCDQLSADVETKTKSLDSLKKAESALAAKAAQNAPAVIHKFDSRESKPGAIMAKLAAANLIAHQERKSVEQVMAERYKDDQKAQAVIKSAVLGADTTTTGWAAELVSEDIAGFIEALRPVSIYAALANFGTAIPFGNANSVKVPRRGTTGGLSGAFVGEQGVIPVGKTNFASDTLNRYKMGVISVFSKELSRVSTPQIEALIRTAMLDDTAKALDTALLDATAAVAGVRPASIRFGDATAAGTAGGGTAAVIADIKGMVGTMIAANTGARPVLVIPATTKLSLGLMSNAMGDFMFRDELARNQLLGIPVISSTNCPANTAILVDAQYFATAFGTPEFDVSDTATLTMANADTTAPTQAQNGSGAIGTAGQVKPNDGIHVHPNTVEPAAASAGFQAQSMYQTWQTAVRMVMPISWGLMMPADTVVVERTNITW